MKPYQSKTRYEPKQSDVVALTAGAGQIDMNVNPSYVHSFAGVVFYDDAEGQTPVQPTAGTSTFNVMLEVQPQAYQEVPNNVLNADTPDQVDWAGNTLSVRAVFSGIAGATYAMLVVAGNSS